MTRVRFSDAVVGDGSRDDPYRPAVFDELPNGWYHLEEMDVEAGTATIVIDTERSPTETVDAIRSGR